MSVEAFNMFLLKKYLFSCSLNATTWIKLTIRPHACNTYNAQHVMQCISFSTAQFSMKKPKHWEFVFHVTDVNHKNTLKWKLFGYKIRGKIKIASTSWFCNFCKMLIWHLTVWKNSPHLSLRECFVSVIYKRRATTKLLWLSKLFPKFLDNFVLWMN